LVSSFARASAPPVRRSHVGSVSLLCALAGAVACRVALMQDSDSGAAWLHVVSAGFEAALVGGLADWFAVTALFRHPLGLPIPHTAIIAARRDKIIDSIVTMVEDEWLSPEVIGARLREFAPSTMIVEWLEDESHVERLGAPLRDMLRALARILSEPAIVEFAGRTVRRQLASMSINASAGQWLARAASGESAAAAFEAVALSVANLAGEARTHEALHFWMNHAADELRKDGKRMMPLLLRRRIVQRTVIEAGCGYVSSELRQAARQQDHPLRRWVFGYVQAFADRLAAGDEPTIAYLEQFRATVVESLEVEPLARDLLTRLGGQLEQDLADPGSSLAVLIDRKLRSAILERLADAQNRETLDRWVRTTADDLLRKNHHQIGITVRENLEALETDALVRQIEDRVGADLQFIRLNGALVGGLIGVLLALLHLFVV